MPMLAMMEFAKKIKNNFIKAIELLRLKFGQKHLAVFCAVLILIGIGLIIPQGFAHAMFESVGNWIMNNLIYRLVYFIFWVLFFIAYAIAYLGAYILDLNLNPLIITTVLNSPMVTQSWAIFRDIANLFFILILLFIAIGTIVRSQSYNLKNLLPKLIIAVFLINFSAVIAKLIIDFGNIFMYGVLKWMNCPGKEECFRDFFPNLMGAIDGFWDKYGIGKVLSPSTQDVVGLVIATFYAFIYGLILIALGTFLMIRIAVFAILIILSPLLAFTGEVFPGLQELSSKWWKNLVNYTLFGPIFALLLYVSGLMAQIQITVPTIGNVNTEALGTFGNIYATVIQYAIPLIFLLAIIPITQELGIAGANAVLGSTVLAGGAFLAGAASFAGGAVDRYMARGAGVKAGKGAGTLARGGAWMRRQGAYLSPGAWKRALEAHKKEAEYDYNVAAGKVRTKGVERASDWPTFKKWGKIPYPTGFAKSPIDYEFNEEISEIYRKNKDIMSTDKDTNQLIFEKKRAYAQGDYKTAMGYDLAIGAKGDADDNLVAHEYKDKNGNTVRYNNSDEDFIRFFKNEYAPKVGEKLADYVMSQVAVLDEKASGNKAFRDTVYFDEKEGRVKSRDIFNDNKEIAEKERSEMRLKQRERFEKDEPQKAMSQLNERTFMDQIVVKKVDVKTGEVKLDKTWNLAGRGEDIIANMTNQYFIKMNRPKGQKLKNILDGVQRAVKEGLREKFEKLDKEKKDNISDRVERLDRFIKEASEQLAVGEQRGGKKGSKANREPVRQRSLRQKIEEEEEEEEAAT